MDFTPVQRAAAIDRSPATASCADSVRRIRLLSYNVHGCIGRDRRLDPARVVKVLSEMPADTMALQEVPPGEHGRAFLEQAAAATGLTPLALYQLPHAHHANALLARFAPRTVRYHDLTIRGCYPRGAIDAELDCDGVTVQVIATHLGLRPGERRKQIRRLLRIVKRSEAPVVLLGDFNEWLAWGRPLRWLHEHFRRPPAIRSFPSALPLFALDRVWVSRPGRVVNIRAHTTPLARIASDHLPVIALVELSAKGTARAANDPRLVAPRGGGAAFAASSAPSFPAHQEGGGQG